MPIKSLIRYRIPFNGEAQIFVSIGDDVKYGQVLFEARRKEILESHFLPKLLSIKPSDSSEYVGRLSGEYVDPGDLLGEKLSAGGMIERKIVAGDSGVVSLERINQGYIDILGETVNFSYESPIEGKIVGITLGSYIEIEAESSTVKLFGSSNLLHALESETNTIVGPLEVIGKGDSVYTAKDLKDSYEGSIVYAGRFLYQTLAEELYLRGVYSVISYSMNYSELMNSKIPVAVVSGYGQIPVNKDFENFIVSCSGQLVSVDVNGKYFSIANKGGLNMTSFKGKKYFTSKLVVGETLMSINSELMGVVGEFSEDLGDESNKIILSSNTKQRVIISKEELESYYFFD